MTQRNRLIEEMLKSNNLGKAQSPSITPNVDRGNPDDLRREAAKLKALLDRSKPK
jgi:hypothetical protein